MSRATLDAAIGTDDEDRASGLVSPAEPERTDRAAALTDNATAMRGELLPGRRKAYILVGNAIVTVRSPSGNRLTFKVTQSEPKAGQMPVWFVGVLSGPSNESDYTYVGTLFAHGFRLTRKSRVGPQAMSFKVFEWLSSGRWEDKRLEVWHEGRCGRCGRTLTVPESIESGIGPTCAAKGGW